MPLPPFASLSVKSGSEYTLDDGVIVRVLSCKKSQSGGQNVTYQNVGDDANEYGMAVYQFKAYIWNNSKIVRGEEIETPPTPDPTPPTPGPIPDPPEPDPTPDPPSPDPDPSPPVPQETKKRGPFDFLDDIYDFFADAFK